jgi:hypothetical protein
MNDRTNRERETLIESTMSAHRQRDSSGKILASPAWHDLLPQDREEAFERQLVSRRLERALDAEGLTTTAREVLRRLRSIEQG